MAGRPSAKQIERDDCEHDAGDDTRGEVVARRRHRCDGRLVLATIAGASTGAGAGAALRRTSSVDLGGEDLVFVDFGEVDQRTERSGVVVEAVVVEHRVGPVGAVTSEARGAARGPHVLVGVGVEVDLARDLGDFPGGRLGPVRKADRSALGERRRGSGARSGNPLGRLAPGRQREAGGRLGARRRRGPAARHVGRAHVGLGFRRGLSFVGSENPHALGVRLLGRVVVEIGH